MYAFIKKRWEKPGRIQIDKKIPKNSKKTEKNCKKCKKTEICKKCQELLSSKVCVINDENENEGVTQIGENIVNTNIMPKSVTGEKFEDKQLMIQLLQRILAEFTGLLIKRKKRTQTRKGKEIVDDANTYEIENYDDCMELLMYKDQEWTLPPSLRKRIKAWARGNTSQCKFYHLYNPKAEEKAKKEKEMKNCEDESKFAIEKTIHEAGIEIYKSLSETPFLADDDL